MGESFDDLERCYRHLWRERSIGAASKLAFMYLWELAKRRPARIVITLVDLGATYGRSTRAAKKWLDELKKAGLIDRVDHDHVRGRVEMDVLHPNPGQREPLPPDPQQRLPLTYPPPAETPDVSAEERPTPAETSDVCAPKGRTFVHSLDVSAHERPTTPCEDAGETPRARRPSVRPSVRTTGMEIEEEIDWLEVNRVAAALAREIPVKTESRYADGSLLMTAALLTQVAIPEACRVNALDRVRRDRAKRNRAAQFRYMLGVEIARHFGQPEPEGKRLLSQLERDHPIPARRVEEFLQSLRKNEPSPETESGPESSEEERQRDRLWVQKQRDDLRRRKAT